MKKLFECPKNAHKQLFLILISLFISTSVFSQWKKVDSGTTQYIWDVHFVDDTIGVAVGWNSNILKTIDGGSTWTQQTVGAGQRLYGVTFKDNLNGYAVGRSETSVTGRFLYTTDGGVNWLQKTVFPLPATALPWHSISFSDEYALPNNSGYGFTLQKNGIIVGQEGQIAYSQDGGETWNKRISPAGTLGIIKDVTFYDGLNAIAVGYSNSTVGFIIKTTDGGASWKNINTNIAGGLNSVSFSDKSNGIAVGYGGVIYKTTDGGENWVPLNSPTTQLLYGVHYNKSKIYAVGDLGEIITSDDDGLIWTVEKSNTSNTLRSVFKTHATTITVGISGTILNKRIPPLKVTNLRNEIKFKELNIDGLSIAADGSSSTLFEYIGPDKENISLSFKEQLTSNPDFYGSFQSRKIVGDTIKFVYNHPAYFSGSSDNRQYKILTILVKNDLTNDTLFKCPIKIVRPSVLMVHGIWSNGVKGFGKMEARLLTEKMYKPYQLLKMTYISDQHNSQSIYEYVKRKDELKQMALDNNISLEKIDVLGHSNGGLLSRYYIQDSIIYKKDINKLITFNTPHSGSQYANLLLDPEYQYLKKYLKILNNNVDNGVIEDLKVDGLFISKLNNPKNIDKKYSNIGVHTITSDELATNTIMGWGRLIPTLLGVKDINLFLRDSVFKSPKHDTVVSDVSQIGGCKSTTPIPNQEHTGSTANSKFQDETIKLLNQSPKNNPVYFSLNGYDPTALEPPVFKKSSKFRNKNSSSEIITVLSPIEGASYNAGEAVPILVNGSSGIKRLVTSMGNSIVTIQSHVVENTTNDNFNFTIPIDALGRLEIVSAGFGTNGYENMASTFINVTTTSLLESLSVDEDLIYVAEGQKTLITILGHYNDGITRNITNVVGINYTFDKNNAEVTESGLVSGLTEGEDLLLISYLGKTTTVPITVEKNSNLSNKDIEELTGISVYPNPTKGILNLKGDLTKLKSVNIYSLTGQHIMEIKKNFNEINMEHLQSGMYMLKINTAEASETIKIIKE